MNQFNPKGRKRLAHRAEPDTKRHEVPMTKRPAIPAELKRRIYVEAGHRCAIPTCRHIEIEIHHIKPWSQTRTHQYENLIALCPNCHARADRGDLDRKSLCIYKAALRYAHDKYSQFEMDVLFDLSSRPENKAGVFPKYMSLLLKRLLDSGFVDFGESLGGVAIGTPTGRLELGPSELVITTKGREFVNSLGEPAPW